MGSMRGLGPELVIADRRPVLRGNLFFFGHGVCAEGTSSHQTEATCRPSKAEAKPGKSGRLQQAPVAYD